MLGILAWATHVGRQHGKTNLAKDGTNKKHSRTTNKRKPSNAPNKYIKHHEESPKSGAILAFLVRQSFNTVGLHNISANPFLLKR